MDGKKRKVGRGYAGTKILNGHIKPCKKLDKHAATSKEVEGDWVSHLPTGILCDMLSRIPTDTIFSCRCVSKAFLKIISSPHFATARNSKLPNSKSCFIFQDRVNVSDFSLAYTSDLEIDSDRNYFPSQVLVPPTKISQSQIKHSAFLVDSVNGLLCMCYASPHIRIPSVYLCNPILGEFMLLPQPRSGDHPWRGAFGYCPKTKLYKVIGFLTSLYTEMHTVGTDYWTTVEKVPYPRTCVSLVSSALNGILHWITEDCNPSNLICSMKLETEVWEYVHPPSQINQDTLRRIFCIEVRELGGLLCLLYVLDDMVEVCVMKDYGVKESWSKEFTIDLKSTFRLDPRMVSVEPIQVLNNGDLLLTYSCSSVVYYNTRKRRYRDVAPWNSYDVVAHVPNFVPLKDIVGEKNVEVVQRQVIHMNWSSPDWGSKFLLRHCSTSLSLLEEGL